MKTKRTRYGKRKYIRRTVRKGKRSIGKRTFRKIYRKKKLSYSRKFKTGEVSEYFSMLPGSATFKHILLNNGWTLQQWDLMFILRDLARLKATHSPNGIYSMKWVKAYLMKTVNIRSLSYGFVSELGDLESVAYTLTHWGLKHGSRRLGSRLFINPKNFFHKFYVDAYVVGAESKVPLYGTATPNRDISTFKVTDVKPLYYYLIVGNTSLPSTVDPGRETVYSEKDQNYTIHPALAVPDTIDCSVTAGFSRVAKAERAFLRFKAPQPMDLQSKEGMSAEEFSNFYSEKRIELEPQQPLIQDQFVEKPRPVSPPKKQVTFDVQEDVPRSRLGKEKIGLSSQLSSLSKTVQKTKSPSQTRRSTKSREKEEAILATMNPFLASVRRKYHFASMDRKREHELVVDKYRPQIHRMPSWLVKSLTGGKQIRWNLGQESYLAEKLYESFKDKYMHLTDDKFFDDLQGVFRGYIDLEDEFFTLPDSLWLTDTSEISYN